MSELDQVGRPTITVARINALAEDSSSDLVDLDVDESISNSHEQSSYWAEQEESLLGKKDLEKVSKDNQHERDEDWKSKFDITFKCLFFLLAFLFALMVVALVLHWIIPESWQWLSESQAGRLETVVIAVLVSKVVTVMQSKIE
ncbi:MULTISPECIES: hypothetical protein [unclassified Psychrobacter]|uniref:hypothetical protein n=1 Tax=unclassified Psychrobacter TaxID=196806 RepID=UPI000946CA31|nr:hypothetical protein [Psychrobacter sp. Rd 27.2]OLF40800.1 hypothetical protein BTV99_07185 [Psychrobacter sp. Rd 27.2]